MISSFSVFVFILVLACLGVFFLWSNRVVKRKMLLHRLFLAVSGAYASWVIPLIILRYVPTEHGTLVYLLDCAIQPGGALCTPLFLCIAVTFATGAEKMSGWLKATFILPVITVLVAWTNPWHHWYYEHFSLIRSEIVFGPYMMISGVFNYLVMVIGVIYLVQYGWKIKTRLYWKQCLLFTISGLFPLVVNVVATFSGMEVPITATPLSFVVTIVVNGIAIFKFNMLDIRSVANEHILNAISDSYIVLGINGEIIKYNRSFEELFGEKYAIAENKKLQDLVKHEDVPQKNPFYELLSALQSSRHGSSHISFEKAVLLEREGKAEQRFFVVDVSPLWVNGQVTGYVALFKDITQLRDSLKKLQESQERMMEQERFAFLGQMIGGLAHNLKTPIMSISGCISASEALVEECESSISDPDVTEEDFREIYGEIRAWFAKIKDSTAYMSDIITAIKGQATNIGTDEQVTFTIDEMLKRSALLMRHEFLNSGCSLKINYDRTCEISLKGDINNLVQVIGNLLNNAIYAQKKVGGGEIEIHISTDDKNLKILVLDRGTGISPSVLPKLFKTMVTSKGAQGTGLGLYFSGVVIRGKFNGEMWGENREGGGSLFGISIPREIVRIRTLPNVKEKGE